MTNPITAIATALVVTISELAATAAHIASPTPATSTTKHQPTAKLLKSGIKVGDTLIPVVYEASSGGSRITVKRERDYDLANELFPAAGLKPGQGFDEFTLDSDSPLIPTFIKHAAAAAAKTTAGKKRRLITLSSDLSAVTPHQAVAMAFDQESA